MRGTIRIPPAPWAGAKAGRCYDNVREMIRQHGGDYCFGWAVGDYGPQRVSGAYPPPLYCRLVNHVVWCDPDGKLWEVSPNITVKNAEQSQFLETEFLADQTAAFKPNSDTTWFLTRVRYVAVRPEGEEVASYLNRAQNLDSQTEKVLWIEKALAALATAGFQPTEWIMHSIGTNTGSIWLYAE